MAKIVNDKYYTSPKLAKYIVEKTIEVLGNENITEYIEPSGGNGVFLNLLPINTYSCDIEPEDDRIQKQDYLTLNLKYLKGRCIIGNPPFGARNNLSRKFYDKSCEIADYISFILPISQLNNTASLYKFDLIYSEDLGKQQYSDRKVHCCFNIYKRPSCGEVNKKQNYKNSLITIVEKRQKILKNPQLSEKSTPINYDIRMLAWGTGIDGKKLGAFLEKEDKQYAKEFYIKINDLKNKDKIISILKNANWEQLYPMTAVPNLLQWQVYKYIGEEITKEEN